MKPAILLHLILCCSMLQAQQVVATQGGTFSNSNGTMSFTIGEGVAQTLTGDAKALTQGFQQSGISVSVLGEPDPGFSITVYPNPATEILNLKIVREDLGDLQYVVFDINGIIIIQKKVEAMETTIDLKQLSKGIYIIRIREGLTELKSFKIIKL
jgi:hypothetical protein